MAKVRNVSGMALSVPWLGRDVADEQVVDVPDEDYDAYVVQVGVWRSVQAPKAKRDKGSD